MQVLASVTAAKPGFSRAWGREGRGGGFRVLLLEKGSDVS